MTPYECARLEAMQFERILNLCTTDLVHVLLLLSCLLVIIK